MQTQREQEFLMEQARDRAADAYYGSEKACGFSDCWTCGCVECPSFECYEKTPCEECKENARCFFFLNGQEK